MCPDDDPQDLNPIVVRGQVIDWRKPPRRLEMLREFPKRERWMVQPAVFDSNGDDRKIFGLADNLKVGLQRRRCLDGVREILSLDKTALDGT